MCARADRTARLEQHPLHHVPAHLLRAALEPVGAQVVVMLDGLPLDESRGTDRLDICDICPNSIECGRPLIPHEGRDDGAECGLCGQWLTRGVITAIFAGFPV